MRQTDHKKTMLMVFLCILALFRIGHCVDQKPTPKFIQLHTVYNQTAQPWTTIYYQISIDQSSTQGKDVLMISLNTVLQSFIGIYISVKDSNIHPDFNNYDNQCSYSTVDSCGINLKNYRDSKGKLTINSIYFGVDISLKTEYDLQVTLQQYLPAKKGQSYKIYFNQEESQILSLPYSEFLANDNQTLLPIVVFGTYQTLKNAGHFQLISALNTLPSSIESQNSFSADPVGAFRRMLKLDPPKDYSDCFYIVVQGQNGTEIDLKIAQYSDMPAINTTYYDLIRENQTYVTEIQNQDKASNFPLFVSLIAYEGHGMFQITYCNGQSKYYYQNLDGSNGEILITPKERSKCFDSLNFLVGSTKQIKMEPVSVKVYDVAWKFGFSISVAQGTHSATWRNEQKWYGVMTKDMDPKVYNLSYLEKYDKVLQLICENVTGIFQFSVKQCLKTKGCTEKNANQTILNISVSNKITINPKNKYELWVTYLGQSKQTTNNLTLQGGEYTFQLIYESSDSDSSLLTTSRVEFNAVSMNQLRYYYIDTSNLGPLNSTELTVILTNVNGQAFLLYSWSEKKPNFTMVYSNDYNVSLAWNGVIRTSIDDKTSPFLYLSVMGDTEASYHLQMVVNTDADLPTRYQRLVQNVNNNIVVQSSVKSVSQSNGTVYLMYSSHSIPYSVTFNPKPDCIKYSSKLPIVDNKTISQQTCLDLPNKFYQKVIYFQITQKSIPTQTPYKFIAFVNVGKFVLQPQKPVFISCKSQCYELITVKLNSQQVNIKKDGYGTLSIANDPLSQPIYNRTYNLKCSSVPCEYTLNASMQYGGQIYLSFETDQAENIYWWTKSMMWSLDKPKRLHFRLQKGAISNSFAIYADGLTPSIFMNIFAIKNSFTNLIDYAYPTDKKYLLKYNSDPTRRMQLVNLDQSTLRNLSCFEQNVYCIVTVSVYVNTSILFNQEYLDYGLGYFSTNDYEYYIQVDKPMHITEYYSLSHFVAEVDNNTSSSFVTVFLQPLSNCRPYIVSPANDQINYRSAKINLIERGSPSQKIAKFSIISNFMCKYYVTVSEVSFETMIHNVLYTKQLQRVDQANSMPQLYTQIFVYEHLQMSPFFQVQVENLRNNPSQSMKLMVTQISSNMSQSQLAALDKFSYTFDIINQTKCTLVINSSEPTKWLIKTTSPFVDRASFMVRQYELPIQLLHNQQQSYTFTQVSGNTNQTNVSSYKAHFIYHTASKFRIFITVSSGEVMLIVSRQLWFSQEPITAKYIYDYSDPWITVENLAKGDIISTFNITIEAKELGPDNKTTITLHTEEEDMRGSLRLYDGVMLIDSFVSYGGKNCYTYYSGLLLGRSQDVILDFTYIDPAVKLQSLTEETSKQVKPSVSVQSVLMTPKYELIQPGTIRTSAKYILDSQYSFCFSLNDQALVGKQYYIVISPTQMQHLPVGYSQSFIEPSAYSLIEIINPQRQSKKLLVNAINCSGSLSVMSSSNFYQAELGRVGHINDQWQNQDSYYGLVDVNSGYFYLGLKTINTSSYQVYSQWVSQNYTILAGHWKLASKTIVQISKKDDNLLVDLPKIANTKGTTDQLEQIVYTIQILNLTGLAKQIKQTDYSKCIDVLQYKILQGNSNINKISLLGNRRLTQESRKAQNKVSLQYLNQSYQIVVKNPNEKASFNLSLQKLPRQFNISAKAQVKLVNNPNVITYFYQPKHYEQPEEGSFFHLFVIGVLVAATFMIIVVVGFIYRAWQRRKQNHVNFEVADKTHNSEQPNDVQMQQQSQPSNRKSLNDKAGYGQFVDETS